MLADAVPFVPAPPVDVELGRDARLRGRDDYKAAQARVAAAEAGGASGTAGAAALADVRRRLRRDRQHFDSMLPTFTAAANVHVPIFDAGKTKARIDRGGRRAQDAARRG